MLTLCSGFLALVMDLNKIILIRLLNTVPQLNSKIISLMYYKNEIQNKIKIDDEILLILMHPYLIH